MLETHSTLFDFAAELTRSHAALLRDDPARVAPRSTARRPRLSRITPAASSST
jgi:hypothetical protein